MTKYKEVAPKNPKKGDKLIKTVESRSGIRKVTMEATGKKGFGAWKITGNKKPKKTYRYILLALIICFMLYIVTSYYQ